MSIIIIYDLTKINQNGHNYLLIKKFRKMILVGMINFVIKCPS